MRISDWSSRRVLFRSAERAWRRPRHRAIARDAQQRVRCDFEDRVDAGKDARVAALDRHRFIIAGGVEADGAVAIVDDDEVGAQAVRRHVGLRSEEHTSELPSLMRISYAFCSLT